LCPFVWARVRTCPPTAGSLATALSPTCLRHVRNRCRPPPGSAFRSPSPDPPTVITPTECDLHRASWPRRGPLRWSPRPQVAADALYSCSAYAAVTSRGFFEHAGKRGQKPRAENWKTLFARIIVQQPLACGQPLLDLSVQLHRRHRWRGQLDESLCDEIAAHAVRERVPRMCSAMAPVH
jgi:hypothetical protein